MDFLLCTGGTSGQALARLVLDQLKSYGLSINKPHGQSYDGAGGHGWKTKWNVCNNSKRATEGSLHALCISLPQLGCCIYIILDISAKHVEHNAGDLSILQGLS